VQLLGILAFVAALLISVTLHEAGHFFTARHYGMKATQFFAGFGPTVWSRKRGETEYGLKAIPLGGYVKIIGMTPLEEVEPGDEDRVFYKHRTWPRFVVLVAGSTVHFVICVVLVFLAVLALGAPQPNAAILSKPADCVPLTVPLSHDDANDTKFSSMDSSGACAGRITGQAKAAHFQNGDRVVSVNGRSIATYSDLTSIVRSNAGKKLTVVVQRHGKDVALQVTPVQVERYPLKGANDVDTTRRITVGAIGITQDPTVLKHVGFINAFPETGHQLSTIVTGTWSTITTKLGSITGIYGPHRDPNGLVGIVGAGRISGEVFALPVPFSYTLLNFLFIIASLNLFVGVFNLLPLLPLDGGHIAVVFFEGVRDRLKRARGYVGEVVHVDYNKLMPITFAVVALFVAATVWILGADIVNPIKLGQ
jgi:membrane-associated protease RseP (regulator of RpoE activity)